MLLCFYRVYANYCQIFCGESPLSSAHSPRFQSLHLRHSWFWFSKLSVTSPTSQLNLRPFPRFTYVTTYSPTIPLLHLRHSSFSNPSFASPTSQDFHLLYVSWRAAETRSFTNPQRKKPIGVRSGDRGGHAIRSPRPIHPLGKCLCKAWTNGHWGWSPSCWKMYHSGIWTRVTFPGYRDMAWMEPFWKKISVYPRIRNTG